jgi:superfamily II DNA or RNA helicase
VTFAVGSLVEARGREWVVLPDSTDDFLLVRPLTGVEAETTGILTSLEQVKPAIFDLPDPNKPGDFRSARLLRDALQLGFRSTAGPFRSLGHIAVTPRSYQLVPLLMALKLDPVRLLIADDVGIGKTIEAGLVAREMLDTGDIRRLAVLCPPHLAEQWQKELSEKFHIDAELVLASTAGRLERNLPADRTIFDEHPFVIVSTDFIKSDRRRDEFLRTCPEFVIVDEAHSCVEQAVGKGAHQRYRLVSGLAADPTRHLVLVTATPHSGKADAFRSLIGLLDSTFAGLPENLGGDNNRAHRERLARHLVQRRRADIKTYESEDPFPARQEPASDPTYQLSDEYRRLFNQVLEFAVENVNDQSGGTRRQRIRWWSMLALLQAMASSPAAAAATLRARSITADSASEQEADEIGGRRIMDVGDDDLEAADTVPGSDPDEESESTRRRLRSLAKAADDLRGRPDAKLTGAVQLVRQLVEDGFHSIVFCRFIDTAEYVAEHLAKALPQCKVLAVTGRIPSEERERRVLELGESARRVLVATDCLSEGINLQDQFNAVLHYDLPWNPTRLEQREGRVDRFGQKSPAVRIVTYYGSDNLIDRAVQDVLLSKHRAIRNDTGISIPVPGSTTQVMEAVSQAVLAHAEVGTATTLPGMEEFVRPAAESLISAWDRAAEREKASRSLFAQLAMRPQDVAAFQDQSTRALGTSADIEDFVTAALGRLKAVISPGRAMHIDMSEVARSVRDQLRVRGDHPTLRVRFEPPVRVGEVHLTRSHPLVTGLAAHVLSSALDTAAGNAIATRAGATRTSAVSTRTTLLLSRVRFHLTTTREGAEHQLLAEQASVCAFSGNPANPNWIDTSTALTLLAAVPTANVTPAQSRDFVAEVVAAADAWMPWLEEKGREAADELLHQHRTAREAAVATGRFRVEALRPIDVLGIYVLLPDLR